MNEKLQELLDSVQRTAVCAGDTAADAARAVGKRAGELLSVAKLNIRIVERKADVNLAFRELGELLYATHTGNPTDSDVLLAKLEEIDAMKAEIADMETQLGREQTSDCAACGAAARQGDLFCRDCGAKL